MEARLRYLDLEPGAMARCDAMWLDSETTIQAVKERFGLGQNDTKHIRAKLGEKPNYYCVYRNRSRNETNSASHR